MDGEAYGVQLAERVRAYDLIVHPGNLYPALRNLEREGFVTSQEGEPEDNRGGRPKRFYKLTGEGRRAAKMALSKASNIIALVGSLA